MYNSMQNLRELRQTMSELQCTGGRGTGLFRWHISLTHMLVILKYIQSILNLVFSKTAVLL